MALRKCQASFFGSTILPHSGFPKTHHHCPFFARRIAQSSVPVLSHKSLHFEHSLSAIYCTHLLGVHFGLFARSRGAMYPVGSIINAGLGACPSAYMLWPEKRSPPLIGLHGFPAPAPHTGHHRVSLLGTYLPSCSSYIAFLLVDYRATVRARSQAPPGTGSGNQENNSLSLAQAIFLFRPLSRVQFETIT